MDTDEILLSMIEGVALDVLERIGDDPEARYQLFKRFVELAKETAAEHRLACERIDQPP